MDLLRRMKGGLTAIVNDTLDGVGVVVVATESVWCCPEPEVGGYSSLIGGDDHIVSLAHANGNNLGRVWYNGNKVRCNDSQSVIVDAEVKVGVCSSIDYSEEVRCSRFDRLLPVGSESTIHDSAIDQSSISSGWTSILGEAVLLACSKMAPVVQEEVAKVNIIVGGSRAVDDNSA